MEKINKILLIQTAFIGDVILATALIENIKQRYPESEIHFCLRKGNESLLHKHPYVTKCLVWDKKKKYQSLFKIIQGARKERYDLAICVQRFFNAGLLTVLCGARHTIGFDKNPLSMFFSTKIEHNINGEKHEIDRNHALLESICKEEVCKPKLHLDYVDKNKLAVYLDHPYSIIAPSSVWETKKLPSSKWIELLKKHPETRFIFIGASGDQRLCQNIIDSSSHLNSISLAGKLSMLESAYLIKNSNILFTNDSAPLHMASAVNARVGAVFCSTVPEFGFGPLSKEAYLIQNTQKLSCRPCGLHGKKSCPEGHFKCGNEINTGQLSALI